MKLSGLLLIRGGFLGMLGLCLRRLSICSMSWGVRMSISIAFRLPVPMVRLRPRVFSAAILRGEGLKTALYTSPQLVRYPERMEVDGRVVSDEAFARGVSAAVESGHRVNTRRVAAGERAYTITPFDLLTAAALVVFAEAAVDIAVLEVGMGGRWDATSATDPVAVAITGIGLDHTRILGDTLEAIAGRRLRSLSPDAWLCWARARTRRAFSA